MEWLGKLLPFDKNSDAYPHQTNLMRIAFLALALFPLMLILKRWMAEVAAAFVGLLFLYHSYRLKDWTWAKTPTMKIAWLLWAYVLFVVTPLALDPMASLSRSLIWGRYLLFFAAIVYWLSSYRDQMRNMTLWMLAIVFAVSVDTYIQYITGESLTGRLPHGNRLTGPMTKLVAGIYLSKLSFPILGLLLHDAWENNRKKYVFFYFTVVTMMMAAIVLSNERTALITYLLGLGATAALLFFFLKKIRKLVLFFSVLQAIVLVMLYSSQPAMKERIAGSVQMAEKFSDSPYAQLWKASWEIWKQNPLTGVGLMNFRLACPPLMETHGITYCDLHSHNVYLEWLSEAGIFGLLGIVALVGSLVWHIVSRMKGAAPNDYILISFALAGLLPTFFPFVATQSFFSNLPAMMAWFSIAMSLGLLSRMKKHA